MEPLDAGMASDWGSHGIVREGLASERSLWELALVAFL
jgi:hypothetical protein